MGVAGVEITHARQRRTPVRKHLHPRRPCQLPDNLSLDRQALDENRRVGSSARVREYQLPLAGNVELDQQLHVQRDVRNQLLGPRSSSWLHRIQPVRRHLHHGLVVCKLPEPSLPRLDSGRPQDVAQRSFVTDILWHSGQHHGTSDLEPRARELLHVLGLPFRLHRALQKDGSTCAGQDEPQETEVAAEQLAAALGHRVFVPVVAFARGGVQAGQFGEENRVLCRRVEQRLHLRRQVCH
mmetsp:Transcript_11147/g.26274  ORF Transcript_11147/g.26274 Transcript_11147/m.26274 type:complete len:239 (+) Transcript_11147:2408-3124(+)